MFLLDVEKFLVDDAESSLLLASSTSPAMVSALMLFANY